MSDVPKPEPYGLTTLLEQLNQGEEGAFARVIEFVYADLKGIASNRLHEGFGGHHAAGSMMQPTALVHEAVIKLQKQRNAYENRDQFFAIATRLMIRVIIDYQRKRLAEKRGGGQIVLRGDTVEDLMEATGELEHGEDRESLVLCQALSDLNEAHPRAAEVLTLHMMCGRKLSDVAGLLGVSKPTVERDWKLARDWLLDRLDSC